MSRIFNALDRIAMRGPVSMVLVGILALSVGGLAALAGIAALFLLAGLMSTTGLALPALVMVLAMYPFWRLGRWWKRRRHAKLIAKLFADLDAGKFD